MSTSINLVNKFPHEQWRIRFNFSLCRSSNIGTVVKVHYKIEKLREDRKHIKSFGHLGDGEEGGRIILSRSMCDYRRGLD
jgi:hypothetical protein